MQLNSIIFPKPSPQYDPSDPQIIRVPSKEPLADTKVTSLFQQQEIVKPHRIPCLHMTTKHSDLYMLYFHGNAEDLGFTRIFLQMLQSQLRINMFAMEYPGYGIYTEKDEPNQEQIEKDAQSVYSYMVGTLNIPEKNIILFGRSIGGGPACFLASEMNPRSLILMSAFQSLQKVATQHASILGYLVKQLYQKDRFNNAERAKQIKCPTLLIHGKSDTLIPYRHSETIYMNLASQIKERIYPLKMTHNDFQINEDLIQPIKDFFVKVNNQAIQQADAVVKKQQQTPPQMVYYSAPLNRGWINQRI